MKHEELSCLLDEYLQLIGVCPSSGQLNLLARHIELVLEANRRINLTRVVDPNDAVRLHTGDSLAVLPEVDDSPPGRLLDLGSGAGFPGIPLAVCTDRTVVLLDSVSKKVRELDAMLVDLGLAGRVTAIASRAEAIAKSERGTYAVVTARAVSELPALVELASPLLSVGGSLICLKGSPSSEEIERAVRVTGRVGMTPKAVRVYDLPEGAGHRTVLTYRKVGSPSVSLPRREGLAQHSPLA